MRKLPIVSFFSLAFGLGAGTIFLVVRGVIPVELALSSALSASVAGIMMTAILDGKSGLKVMRSRVMIWRAGVAMDITLPARTWNSTTARKLRFWVCIKVRQE